VYVFPSAKFERSVACVLLPVVLNNFIVVYALSEVLQRHSEFKFVLTVSDVVFVPALNAAPAFGVRIVVLRSVTSVQSFPTASGESIAFALAE
jgi:hypothetical protein